MPKSTTDQAREIRDHFYRRYRKKGLPASETQILRAEQKIGLRLPGILRELYLLSNGFRGPSGTPYLLSLVGDNSIVAATQMLRENKIDDVSGFICFGESFGSYSFAMREEETGLIRIVAWDPEGGLIELGKDLFKAYLRDEEEYEETVGGK